MTHDAVLPAGAVHIGVLTEYVELPGLILTLPQAARLFHLQPRACADILNDLVEAGFLRREGPRYARVDRCYTFDVTGGDFPGAFGDRPACECRTDPLCRTPATPTWSRHHRLDVWR